LRSQLVIEIVELAGSELGADLCLAAERFATPAYDLATAYSNSHEAHLQFGG